MECCRRCLALHWRGGYSGRGGGGRGRARVTAKVSASSPDGEVIKETRKKRGKKHEEGRLNGRPDRPGRHRLPCRVKLMYRDVNSTPLLYMSAERIHYCSAKCLVC